MRQAVQAHMGPAQKHMRWLPLLIKSQLANTDDDIARNIESAIKRNLRRYMEISGTERGAVSIVGSGPSLKRTWQNIAKVGGDIIACNAACQFLLERGIVPKYMMCFDADPLMLEFLTPHKGITYLLGSRCPPKAFDMLEGCDIVCWHAAGDRDIESILQKHGRFDDPMIPGGSAAVTRAMVIAQTLGYKEHHLWGADSSFDADDTHIRRSTTVEKRMHVNLAGRTFETAPWMTQQVEDFKVLAPPMRDFYGVRLTVHGDGLIPQVAASMGFAVDGPLARRQFWRQWKWRFNTLLANI